MGAGAGTGAGTGGGQSATPSQDGAITGSVPSFMRDSMAQQLSSASQMGSQAPSQMGSQAPSQSSGSPLSSFGGLGSAFGGGAGYNPQVDDFIPRSGSRFSAPPSDFNPQQSAPPMGFRNLSAMMGGGFDGGRFNPVGRGGRFFSPVDQGSSQPFGVNTTTPTQFQAASYPQGSIANQLASGYQQVFGRGADPSGMEYWSKQLGGRNLSQGEVNRYLLGGAAGADVEAGGDYAMSLTGGRPSLYDTSKPLTDSAGKPILDPSGKPQYEYRRQYNQPVYSPTYTNYGLNRGFYSPGYGMGLGGGFSGGGPFGMFGGGYGGYGRGFNPFSYAAGGNVYADDNNEEDQGIAGLLGK